jgi:hypothetical protein
VNAEIETKRGDAPHCAALLHGASHFALDLGASKIITEARVFIGQVSGHSLGFADYLAHLLLRLRSSVTIAPSTMASREDKAAGILTELECSLPAEVCAALLLDLAASVPVVRLRLSSEVTLSKGARHIYARLCFELPLGRKRNA